LPQTARLSQNYPNPFNPATNIQFTNARTEQVVLKVYDVLGREVTTLVNDVLSAGTHSVRWDAGSVAGGVYFSKMQVGDFVETRKMVLVK
jgi:hypothetical protein